MTQQEAHIRMLARALEMAQSGWVARVLPYECLMTKIRQFPKCDRTLLMSIGSNGFIHNKWSDRPCRCETCGSPDRYADVNDDEGQPSVICKECLTKNPPKNGMCGIVEWGWSDSEGEMGVAGVAGESR